ncbi:hypothetical protein KUTeg_004707 [Tegillarca granosa]|uniref:Uncharacterized protein n=1 Tax=Tegillarca granosa TaxID=220873 RepID=A0ABQ9FHL6_TEGGR|nr:hypothetical protein KUTeg_004707 [Tegillarca granosa]
MQQFDNFTNIKGEQHLENKEISELTSFEVDLKSNRNNQFKSMVASSETKPDSDNSVNICCKDDISGKVVEDNASKMPDTNNSNKNFTVEKVASFTYAMKRSVSLDRDLDQKKKYETYVATEKISKMDHSKKDVKSVKMNRVTKHTKPRIPIIPQESVISEHIRRSNNSYYRGGTHIPPPLPAKLLFKFGLSSKNPASGDYGLSFPIGVASNSKGELIVADTGNNRIRIFDAHGRFVQGIGSKQSRLKRPSAIVINDDDNIFVKDDICIHVFTPDCKFVRRIGNGQLNAPYGM